MFVDNPTETQVSYQTVLLYSLDKKTPKTSGFADLDIPPP